MINKKKIIGRIDKVDFPEFNFKDLPIKIDSGAYTSTIYCSFCEETIIDGIVFLNFNLLDKNYDEFPTNNFSTKNFSSKVIKSSNGISEKRYLIKTKILMFNEEYPIYLTLSERKEMKFPVLLGRKFLNKKFIIDTTKTNLSYKEKTAIRNENSNTI